MSGMESIGNLSRSGVRPLRSTAKARDSQPVQTFDLDAMRNGGAMEIGGMLEGDLKSIRDQYRGGGEAHAKARDKKSSHLSKEEQLEKLNKIGKSAVDYEAVFVDQFVKQMRPSPMAKTAGGDTLSDIAEQPFRDFLSQNGGLGLANTIVNQVARQEGLEQTLQENPSVMGPSWRPTVPQNLMKRPLGNLEMLAESPVNKGETPAENTLNTFLAGIEKAAGSAIKAEEKSPQLEKFLAGVQQFAGTEAGTEEKFPMKTAGKAVGMVSGEEISYLYHEAQEGLA